MRRARTALACAAALALSAGSAYAQEDGVFVDPDSPSGREYAIPLESARRQADPRPVSPRSASSRPRSATLFGEGVVTARSARAGDSGGSRKAGGGSAKDRESDGRNPVRENPLPKIVGIAASRPGAPDGGVGTPALVGGAGLLVLLLGAVAGFLVRRRAN